MCYVKQLLDSLEAHRQKAELTINDVAPAVGVTPLTYKKWLKGAIPHPTREKPMLETIKVINDLLLSRVLPLNADLTGKERRQTREHIARHIRCIVAEED